MRCQQVQPWFSSVPLLAEAVTIGMGGLAPQNLLFTARLSPEKAGPMIAMMLGSWISAVAAAGAFVGSPWLSDGTSWILNLYLPDWVAWSMAICAPSRSLMPSCALAPDNAPMKPILYVWLAVLP